MAPSRLLCDGSTAMLTCIECGATAEEHTPNWRAYVAEPEDDDGEFVVIYCPTCAEREFGPFQPDKRSLGGSASA